MKSVILEALAAYGYGELIRQSDIEVPSWDLHEASIRADETPIANLCP